MTEDELREHAEKIGWIVMKMAQFEEYAFYQSDPYVEMVAKIVPVPRIIATLGKLSPGQVNGIVADIRRWEADPGAYEWNAPPQPVIPIVHGTNLESFSVEDTPQEVIDAMEKELAKPNAASRAEPSAEKE